MAEGEDAIKLANAILNQQWRDPDDDGSVLARQLLRTREALDAATAKLLDLEEGRAVILPANRDHAEKMNIVAEAFLQQPNAPQATPKPSRHQGNIMPDEPFTISNSQLLALMTEEDRVITRSVLQAKRHLGPLGMIEIAYMLGKLRGRVRNLDDEKTESS